MILLRLSWFLSVLVTVEVARARKLLAFVAKNGASSYGNGPATTSTQLGMGLLDSMSSFLRNREGDFVKLDKTEMEYGPGPLVLLYKVPAGVTTEEIEMMVEDGAPTAFRKGVQLRRITKDDDALLDLSMSEALEQALTETDKNTVFAEDSDDCPVLLFSGFRHDEMLPTYEIIGREIYEETGGRHSPACAKVVPHAMQKPLRQVLEEISSDHMDAISQ